MKRNPLFFLLALMLSIAAFAAVMHVKVTGYPGSPDSFAEGFAGRVRDKLDLRKRGFQPPFVLHYGNESIIENNILRNSMLSAQIPKAALTDGYKDHNFNPGVRSKKGFHSGREFLEKLLYYPGGECIPKLTVVGHGWGNSKPMGGEGIPILLGEGIHVSPGTGVYIDEPYRQKALKDSLDKYVAQNGDSSPEAKRYIANAHAASAARGVTLDDLNSMMTTGTMANGLKVDGKKPRPGEELKKVKFCNESGCTIQLYACNIGDKVAQKLLRVTGCQVIYGSGNLTGGRNLKDSSGNYDHYWWGDSKDGTLRKDSGMIKRITPSSSNEFGFTLDHMISETHVYDSINMKSVLKSNMQPVYRDN